MAQFRLTLTRSESLMRDARYFYLAPPDKLIVSLYLNLNLLSSPAWTGRDITTEISLTI